MFLQGNVEGFCLSTEISWGWQAELGISSSHRMWGQPGCSELPNPSWAPPVQQELAQNHFYSSRAGNAAVRSHPPPTMATENSAHLELRAAGVHFNSLCSENVFRGTLLIPSAPSGKCAVLTQGSSFILGVDHSEVIHCSVFMGYCCPSPLRLPELANAIFICLCSCCTADTDNTSVVFSASTNRELAHLNNPWTGSNLAARLDFS